MTKEERLVCISLTQKVLAKAKFNDININDIIDITKCMQEFVKIQREEQKPIAVKKVKETKKK